MGSWGYYQYPTEPPCHDCLYLTYCDCDSDYYAEMESLDERAEQETDDIPVEDENDWGAWLESGERPVPNAG